MNITYQRTLNRIHNLLQTKPFCDCGWRGEKAKHDIAEADVVDHLAAHHNMNRTDARKIANNSPII